VRVVPKYGEDEANTLTKTVLLMRIGGGNGGIGIHGTHLGPGVVIRYAHTDESRQTIPWIEYTGPGRKTVYTAADTKPDPGGLPVREMDCMDCHNRPSHTFELPERAMDHALSNGAISANLPFAKKKGVEILKAEYGSHEEAARRIPAEFEKFYRESYPEIASGRAAEVKKSSRALFDIYSRNVFPAMNVKWGAYPNNIGHTDFPGCFRCHDSAHNSTDNRSISQDCNSCHNLLAMDEPEPKILTELGVVETTASGPSQ
jgi:hypothetical protein